MQQIFGAGLLSVFCGIITVQDQLYTNYGATRFLCALPISGEGSCDMQLYADLFKENHITGKRLLLLTENDMRDMGVKSKGHVMHLKARHS